MMCAYGVSGHMTHGPPIQVIGRDRLQYFTIRDHHHQVRTQVRHPILRARRLCGERVAIAHRGVALQHVGKPDLAVRGFRLADVGFEEIDPRAVTHHGSFPGVLGRSGRHVQSLLPCRTTFRSQSMMVASLEIDAGAALLALATTS